MAGRPDALAPMQRDTLRQYCRNPRCGSKLPQPMGSVHAAFCTRGCWQQFHRHRCVVCERSKQQQKRGATRLVCERRVCRAELGKWPDLYQPFAHKVSRAGKLLNNARSTDKTGVKTRGKTARPECTALAIAAQGDTWRVRQFDNLQWVVEALEDGNWVQRAYCRTKEGLLFALSRRGIEASLAALPSRFPEKAGEVSPAQTKSLKSWYWERGVERRLLYDRSGRLAARIVQEGEGWWVAYPAMTPEAPLESLEAATRRGEMVALWALPLDPATAQRIRAANRAAWRDRRPVTELQQADAPSAIASRWQPSPTQRDCPDIPEFLRRTAQQPLQPSPSLVPADVIIAAWDAATPEEKTEFHLLRRYQIVSEWDRWAGEPGEFAKVEKMSADELRAFIRGEAAK